MSATAHDLHRDLDQLAARRLHRCHRVQRRATSVPTQSPLHSSGTLPDRAERSHCPQPCPWLHSTAHSEQCYEHHHEYPQPRRARLRPTPPGRFRPARGHRPTSPASCRSTPGTTNLGSTLADAICDVVLRTAMRLELRGESMRKPPPEPPRERTMTHPATEDSAYRPTISPVLQNSSTTRRR